MLANRFLNFTFYKPNNCHLLGFFVAGFSPPPFSFTNCISPDPITEATQAVSMRFQCKPYNGHGPYSLSIWTEFGA